ncbi:MAG: trypsin-like peptidase domain-containing protein [Candidatus Bathyarchaeia archaeon]
MKGGKTVTQKTAVVLIISVVVLASISTYSSLALRAEATRITQLQTLASDLESRNTVLENALSSQPQPAGNASFGLNAVAIYDISNQSVVTVQSTQVSVVQTIFGPQTGISSVLGSGFVVDYSNAYYIVTNFHVIDSAVNSTVTFWDGDSYPAKVIGSYPYSDIAVIITPAPESDFHPLKLPPSASLRVGQTVMAIGNPFGLSGSITIGIVSQLGRNIQYQSASQVLSISDVIQFSAPINPGNSGGPLLNAGGMVVGITTATASGSQGVGFAIPSDTILRELPSIISSGGYRNHPDLGIQAADMNYELSQVTGANVTNGVLIEKTVSGGPADQAGLRGGQQITTIAGQQYIIGGDVIVSVNGNRIVSYDALSTYLERYILPGQIIRVGIIRSGNYQEVEVTVGAASDP